MPSSTASSSVSSKRSSACNAINVRIITCCQIWFYMQTTRHFENFRMISRHK
jgi:hypothetical protein